jgi:hypothetical protein
MTKTRKKPSARLKSARAYYRLAAKADRAGQFRQAKSYRKIADRFVERDRVERAFVARLKLAHPNLRSQP